MAGDALVEDRIGDPEKPKCKKLNCIGLKKKERILRKASGNYRKLARLPESQDNQIPEPGCFPCPDAAFMSWQQAFCFHPVSR